jgi:hypothetical protein
VENTAQPGRPQMTIQYSACALHDGYLRLQTQATIHTFCSYIATMVARTPLNATPYIHSLSCSKLILRLAI